MKKTLSILLSILMVFSAFSVMPFSAFAVENYNLWIAGTRVNSGNAADVLGDGTVSYDNGTKTLTLNNADIKNESDGSENYNYCGVTFTDDTGFEKFNIVLKGNSTVFAKNRPDGQGMSSGIYSVAETIISGSGKLEVFGGSTNNYNASYGICVENELTVENAEVSAYSSSANKSTSVGVYVNDSLTVDGGKLYGNSSEGEYSFGIRACKGITLKNGAEIFGVSSKAVYNSFGVESDRDIIASDSVINAVAGKSTHDGSISIGLTCRMSLIATKCQITVLSSASNGSSYGIRQETASNIGNYSVTFNSCKVKTIGGSANNGNSYGIITGYSGTNYVPVNVNNSTLEAWSDETGTVSNALCTFTLGEDMLVSAASKNANGTPLIKYDGGTDYKYLKINPCNKYTVTLDANGGIKGPKWQNSFTEKEGTTGPVLTPPAELVTAPPCTVFDGFEFDGVRYAPNSEYTLTKDVTLKLLWKANHVLKHISATPATTEKSGNIEYYVCDKCGKYYADSEGKTEITDKNSVIINKKPSAPVLSPEDAALPTAEKTEQTVKNTNTDKGDVAGSLYEPLMLKATTKKKTVTLKWKAQSGADGYIIYGAPCGQKLAKLADVKTTKYTFKKLKKGKYYKYVVVAYKKTAVDNRVLSVSKSVHIATKGGKKGNPTGIKTKKKITLKKGKKSKIKATLLKKEKLQRILQSSVMKAVIPQL